MHAVGSLENWVVGSKGMCVSNSDRLWMAHTPPQGWIHFTPTSSAGLNFLSRIPAIGPTGENPTISFSAHISLWLPLTLA